METDEVSKEGQMVEYLQQASQDTNVQTTCSKKIETIEGEPSQRERTPERSDKGKEVVEHNPSSSRGGPLVKWVPRWLRKEMMRNKNPQFNADEEDMIELAKVLRKLESPLEEARALAFINSTQDQDLFSQVDIPPLDVDVESLGPQDYQIRKVMLGKPTLDIARLMVIMGNKGGFQELGVRRART